MAHEKAISEGFDALWGKSLERNWIPGRLGLPGGFPVYDVPDRPGYKYVNKGIEGEQGQVLALDKVGVQDVFNQRVRMRREFGQYIIREAEYYADGGSGSSTFAALTDVALTSLADGETIQYDSGTSKWVNVVPPGGAGGAPSPHGLSSVHHNGTLDWTDINFSGSDIADISNRAHSDLSGVTANQHHNQVHVLATGTALGADHSISGATAGDVLRALSATTAAFDVLQHNDLGGVTANQHHNQIHSITGADHTITGSTFQVVGATATNTLGLLTPSSGPGAAAAILRTDSNGGIALDTALFVVAASTDLVTIDTNLFYADGPNNRIGVNRTPGAAALDVKSATNADHTLRVTQKSGQTGRLWRVEDTSGNELIVLDSQGNLQSGNPGFVSGSSGWQITPTGTAEFNNVFVRGELHATVFVKDEVHAVGGTLLVATAGKIHTDVDVDSTTVDTEDLEIVSTAGGWTGTTLSITSTSGSWTGTVLEVVGVFNYIEIDDPPSGPGLYFFDGDVIRSKAEVSTGVTDQWFTVRDGHQLSGYSRYSVTKESGTDEVIPAGSAMVSWGQVGDGRIIMTSDLNHAPYLDVFSVGPQPWTGSAGSTTTHVRLGQLEGVGVTAVSGISQYGMIAGTNLQDANAPYLVASDIQLSLYKVDLTLNDGSNDTVYLTAEGDLSMGTNVGAGVATTSFNFTSADGDLLIGQEAGNYLKWNQSGGLLTINGALAVGGVGVATTTYVDGGDSVTLASAATDATTKANTAQSTAISTASGDATTKANAAQAAAEAAAEAFAQTRRVTGVSGTWTSTDADTITWGTPTDVQVRLGDGTSKTISDGNTGTMTVRTYLFVDATATAPLTMLTTTALSGLGANHSLIAVADPGTDFASVAIVAGSTYISGDNIITGSIVAANIKAGAITATQIAATTITAAKIAANTITANQIAANAITATELAANSVTAAKINVTDLNSVSANTGTLSVTSTITVGTSGSIFSSGKTYGGATAGFFLGRSSGAYKVDIGDGGSNFLLWDGTSMTLGTDHAITVNNTSTGQILSMRGPSSSTGLLTLSAGNVLTASVDEFTGALITATKLVVNSHTFQIAASRTIASSGATGVTGDMTWDTSYLYICTGTNNWKRIPLSSGGTYW